MLSTVLFCLFFCSQIQSQHVSFYPSDINMRPYLHTLKSVVEQLEEAKNDRKRRLELVTGYLDHYTYEHARLQSDQQSYLENPINQFTFLYGLTKGLDFVRTVIKGRREFKISNSLQYPTLEDMELNVISLSRLQRFYKLNITQLAAGILNTSYSESGKVFVEYFAKMTSSDCYILGKIMSKYRLYKEAASWLIEALKLYDRDKNISDFEKEKVYLSLCKAYEMLDDSKNFLKWARELLEFNVDYLDQEMTHSIVEHQSKMEYLQLHKATMPYKQKKISANEVKKCTGRVETGNYRRHCRAEMSVPPQITKSLKCWYFTGYHPFLRLAPIRTEQLYSKPDIFFYHNVINDREIENITSMELNECETAQDTPCVNSLVLQCLKNVGVRQCMTNRIGPSADHITQRVFDFTGLRSAEYPIISTYYSSGSYFFTHTDSSRQGSYVECAKRTKKKVDNFTVVEVGNKIETNQEQMLIIYQMCLYRVQTVLFYLSNVPQGGATVFPVLGLTVWPKKGSALSWTTMYPPTVNDVTCHSACPVLRGNKWVATKWINFDENELSRPCVEQFPNRHPIDIPAPVPKEVYFK